MKCYIDLFGERPSNTCIWPLCEGEPHYLQSRSVAAVSYDEEEYSSSPVFRHQAHNHEAVIVHEESPSVLQLAHPVNGSSLEFVEEVATSEVADQGGMCTIHDMDVPSMEVKVEMNVKDGKATTLTHKNAQDTSDNANAGRGRHLSNDPKTDIAVKLNVTAPPFVPNLTASPFAPKAVAETLVNESNVNVDTPSSEQGLGGSEQVELANARAVVEVEVRALSQNVPSPVAGDGMKLNSQDETPDEKFMTSVAEKMEDMRLRGSSSASLEQVMIAKSQSPLSAKARPFTPPGFSSSAQAKSVSDGAKSAKSKAVVVSISASKQSATKVRPTILPGMEYLMGEDEARVVVERKAQLEERKKVKKQGRLVKKAQRKAEERKAVELDRKRQTMEAKREKEAAMKQGHEKEGQKYQVEMPANKTNISSPPTPKLEQDDEELPSVDEMMLFLGDKSMSREERQRQLDKMFG